MSLLLLFLDLYFYTFTPIKTSLFLIPLLNKEDLCFYFPLLLMWEIFIVQSYGLFLSLNLILICINKQLKFKNAKLNYYFKFIIDYIIWSFYLFSKLNYLFLLSFLITLIFVIFCYKNASI